MLASGLGKLFQNFFIRSYTGEQGRTQTINSHDQELEQDWVNFNKDDRQWKHEAILFLSTV